MAARWTNSNEKLIEAVYPEMRNMAERLLRGERDGHTLQSTALAHEAFIRLFGEYPVEPDSLQGFLALAAHKMRGILIDYGRKRHARKRGGSAIQVPLLENHLATASDEDTLLGLNEALERLGRVDPRALSVVELKFFCGYTNPETARILGVSDGTVESDWQFARSWLFGALTDPVALAHFGRHSDEP